MVAGVGSVLLPLTSTVIVELPVTSTVSPIIRALSTVLLPLPETPTFEAGAYNVPVRDDPLLPETPTVLPFWRSTKIVIPAYGPVVGADKLNVLDPLKTTLPDFIYTVTSLPDIELSDDVEKSPVVT